MILIYFYLMVRLSYGLCKFSNERQFQNSILKIHNGDWGGIPIFPYRTIVQQNVALFMHNVSKNMNVHFQLGLGDNFYFDGVKSVDDKRFKLSFEDVFLDQEIPWFFILGNHDYLGNPHAQIEYTERSKRWILPNYNYSISVNINQGKNKLIYILMIDTVLLSQETEFRDRSNKVKTLNVTDHKKNDYFQEIEETLKKISLEKYPYVIVAGHYPVWSVSEHGPTKILVDKLRPLLHKYKVNAYFAGHEHDMEHLSHTYMNSTVEYIITGIANLPYYSTEHLNDVPKDSLKYYWADIFQIHGALALVEADLNAMNITYIKTNGEKLYQIKIKNKF
ncbi:unnamed protein product [Brachionus calyciflorus]|uniref:Tartrate-resistant acid phosphatase type 5 n=1 Tax=Brachionus calyciflorus TaxID=104777 RepID=A0A813PMN9_9BILA|nr:unnamed protein product [Brachionus calyciflorus]